MADALSIASCATTSEADLHEWDYPTDYCVRCGASMMAVMNGERVTCEADGVVAISHILARRNFARLFPGL